ncbi:MAG TPA: FHA domain-containing serine/threonine-protein kinase [Vicinamibacteria bacterium]|nr:FHA domain-containing serine/threonine-protein kinase [Vicinamibacteria bacterium]
MPSTISLVVTAGPIRGQRFDFPGHDTFVFGRAPECHARLASSDASASRHHFLLEVNPPLARLRDLGSLNGTHVNGVRHGGRRTEESPEEAATRDRAEVDLRHGDEIRVGATVIRVEVSAPPACSDCGRPILDAERERCGWVGGAYLCEACRRGTVTGRGPAADASPLARLAAKGEAEDAGGAPGSMVGPYAIERLLGKGGMGAVYLARRLGGEPSPPVALKVMLPRMVVDEGAQEIFIREIEVTRALRHPNIVGLLDFGKHQGRFYFALEYCAGGSTEQLRRRHGGRVPLPSTLHVAVGALEGLAAAHDAGFVHRDIKPDNVLLAEDGAARLADFGLAKSFQQAGLSGMTATGTVAGTFQFMPREQLTSYRQARPTTDVWSMAATIYYLLTGQFARDFAAHSDPLAVILRGGVVPLRQRDPSVPEDLAAVIDRALDDDPSRRFPTARELVAALRGVL